MGSYYFFKNVIVSFNASNIFPLNSKSKFTTSLHHSGLFFISSKNLKMDSSISLSVEILLSTSSISLSNFSFKFYRFKFNVFLLYLGVLIKCHFF